MRMTLLPSALPDPTDPVDDPTAPLRAGHLRVVPWIDPTIERVGHDPRSPYVERFWLSVLGPSATWLLRRMAYELEARPEGCTIDLAEAARAIGLGTKGGRHTTYLHAVDRTCEFGLARYLSETTLAVRRRVPPLTRNQLARLPAALRDEHDEWMHRAPAIPDAAEVRRRAQQLAVGLVDLGEDIEATELQLHRWRFHPALAHEVATWAWAQRHGEPPHETATQAS
jgi:hypothetical protein